MTGCNHKDCKLLGTVHVFDERGTLVEILCAGHAVIAARAVAGQFTFVDAATGRDAVRVTVEVLLEA